MKNKKPQYLSVRETVDLILQTYGNDVKIGIPLGLGKPNLLINELYARAKADAGINLTIYTALSLEQPVPASDLQARLLNPFLARQFKGVPDLDYQVDLRAGKMPGNITVSEIYVKAGGIKGLEKMQQNYLCSNYTHVVRDTGNHIFAHSIAKKETREGSFYSCSCNADTALETIRSFHEDQQAGAKRLLIGMVNSHLPFMYGDAVLTADNYDVIIDEKKNYHPLFATPRAPISVPDYMIGFHASSLIKDNGTPQIGIGALGDSIAYNLHLRHNENDAYQKLLADSGFGKIYQDLVEQIGGTAPFENGLYGSTEMLVDGFLQLYKKGIIKRKVYHHAGLQKLINAKKIQQDEIPRDILRWMIQDGTMPPYLTQDLFDVLQTYGVFRENLRYEDGMIVSEEASYPALLADDNNLAAISENCLGETLRNGVVLTGAFFLGPQDFYDDLNEMPDEERMQFEMTGVDVANQLYGGEELRRLERINGRFCNTGMKATLLGAISSDALEDGTVISGVGGQYNFVSMAHALEDGRCIMMIKSSRTEGGNVLSNIVYQYGNITIPRHLRDIIITEYGIADIRGKCDQDIIKQMLNITDSRFQDELMAEAKKNGKLSEDYEIPEQFRNNTPEKLNAILTEPKAQGLFPDFPFGAPMTMEELFIAFVLKNLAAKSQTPQAAEFPALMQKLPEEIPDTMKAMFIRMGLEKPSTKEEVVSQKTLLLAFHLAGFC